MPPAPVDNLGRPCHPSKDRRRIDLIIRDMAPDSAGLIINPQHRVLASVSLLLALNTSIPQTHRGVIKKRYYVTGAQLKALTCTFDVAIDNTFTHFGAHMGKLTSDYAADLGHFKVAEKENHYVDVINAATKPTILIVAHSSALGRHSPMAEKLYDGLATLAAQSGQAEEEGDGAGVPCAEAAVADRKRRLLQSLATSAQRHWVQGALDSVTLAGAAAPREPRRALGPTASVPATPLGEVSEGLPSGTSNEASSLPAGSAAPDPSVPVPTAELDGSSDGSLIRESSPRGARSGTPRVSLAPAPRTSRGPGSSSRRGAVVAARGSPKAPSPGGAASGPSSIESSARDKGTGGQPTGGRRRGKPAGLAPAGSSEPALSSPAGPVPAADPAPPATDALSQLAAVPESAGAVPAGPRVPHSISSHTCSAARRSKRQAGQSPDASPPGRSSAGPPPPSCSSALRTSSPPRRSQRLRVE